MADVTPDLGQRVFMFCSRLRCSPEEVDSELAALEEALDASGMEASEADKLRRMVRMHAERLRQG